MEKIKSLDMLDIVTQIAEAANEALLQKIEANTLIINAKYAKTAPICQQTLAGAWEIPPMLCGLRVAFANLPEKIAFALAELPHKNVEEIAAEAKKETAKEILEMLIGHKMAREDWTWVVSWEDVAFVAEKYGVEWEVEK